MKKSITVQKSSPDKLKDHDLEKERNETDNYSLNWFRDALKEIWGIVPKVDSQPKIE